MPFHSITHAVHGFWLGFRKSDGGLPQPYTHEDESIRGFINLDVVVPQQETKRKFWILRHVDDLTLDVDHQPRVIKECL